MNNKKIVFFGASLAKNTIWSYVRDYIKNSGFEIKYFVDNDKKKWGNSIEGHIIKNPEILKDKSENVYIIITSQYFKEITEQLKSYNLKRNEDFITIYDDSKIIKYLLDSKYKELIVNSMMAYKNSEQSINELISSKEIREKLIRNSCSRFYSGDGKVYPSTLILEFTTLCNLQCVYCPYHSYLLDKKHIPKSNYLSERLLDKVIKNINQLNTIELVDITGRGETFLHPKWYEFCKKIEKETYVNKLHVTTNGMLLNKENIDKLSKLNFDEIRVVVSIDGINKCENNSLRKNSDFDLITNNIVYLQEKIRKYNNIKLTIQNIKIPFKYELNCSENIYKSIPSFIKDNIGTYYDFNSWFPLVNSLMKDTLKRQGFKIKSINTLIGADIICVNMYSCITVRSDGEVVECPCNGSIYTTIGNINTELLLDIWNNNFINRSRNILEKGSTPKKCIGCAWNVGGKYEVLYKDEIK